MNVLVTGIGGFAGPPVARALLARGHAVAGVLRPPFERPRLEGLPLTLHAFDLLDPERLRAVVAGADAVLHLAGLSSAPAAERDPGGAYRANLGGTLAVLAAVRSAAPRARILAVTSAGVYGAVEAGELPVGEDVPLRPLTVYGASKAAADLAAAQWGRAYGLDVVRARPFNHTGPGQDAAFVCAALARQIACIEAGRQEAVVHAGNLDPVRDFSDVNDVAAGYVALLERGRSGAVYNLCSATGCSIAEVVAILRTHARVAVRVTSDAALRRAHDVPRLVGTHARATRDTGWEPRIAWSDTLAGVLEDWRARVALGE
ncbi:MAG: NAD-dependent epimerase/dehydratase family protein [Deltaproteobacteria bacterium]|nr:MAG: NAD-dependent epimerase/dehydratase family protein [Deltaproteobacteria bacterium]